MLYNITILYSNGKYEVIKDCRDIIAHSQTESISFYEKATTNIFDNRYKRHYIVMDNRIKSVVITLSESEVKE